MRAEDELGAFRTSYYPVGSVGIRFSTLPPICYVRCNKCGHAVQSVRKPRLALGSTSRGPLTDAEMIATIKRDSQTIGESERLRRAFRLESSRCTCSRESDERALADPKRTEERAQREGDIARPEVAPPGWHRDPSKRAQYRFWNGLQWTNLIANDGLEALDHSSWSTPAVQVKQSSKGATRTTKARRTTTSKVVDLAGQVRELSDLHAAGVLTQQQFEAAKNKLLGLDQ